jgi:LuxR family maltose regulon positive regulatory protein
MIFLEMWEATFVRIRLAQAGAEHLEQARVMLDALRTFVWRTHIVVHQIDVLALEALLHRAFGEPQAALAALEQALALAAPAEIVRPFVDLGQPMATLLREAAQGGAQADFATTVLAAFPDGGEPGVARSSLVPQVQQATLEPLTNRELEVLALLSEHLSNKEIAAILVVSPETVKKHIHNVYSKLQVTGRREAIARALALRLLNPPI